MIDNAEFQPASAELLARLAVEVYLRDQTTFEPPEQLPNYLIEKAGTFVSIKTSQGELRGCIGTIQPVCDSVAREIVRNAIKAATEDFRFRPICAEELAELVYSVDILTPLEPILDLSDHDPKIYGLMIEAFGRRGVLLPDLPGIETAEQQLSALQFKIGLSPDQSIQMSRFRVQRFGKKA